MSFLPCKSRVMLTLALGLICLIFMSSTPLYAAGGRCVIKGKVTSHTLGEAMSDALVKITNEVTGKSAYKRTDVNGDYLFPRFRLEGTDNKLEVRGSMPRYNSSFTYINTASPGETITHDIELIDRTRPIQYGVSDKARYTKSQDTLYATWKPASDPQSGIVDYLAAVGTAKHQADVKDWHSIGNVTEITLDNLNLQENTTYYIGIQAVNGDGLGSKLRWSNGVTVDTVKPEVSITNPLDNSAVSGTVYIEASATDDTAGIKKVRFYIDGVLMYKDDSSPYSYSWDSSSYSNDSHTIKAIAIDNVGHRKSDLITVNVANVPALPSLVRADGYQIMVQRRKLDGSLEPEAPYTIKGACWSPAKRGTPHPGTNEEDKRAEFWEWCDTDIPLIAAMNANTIRTYQDFGLSNVAPKDWRYVLDACYANGIMVVINVDRSILDTNRIEQIVPMYKDHPAVLMWSIGNEWNINNFYGAYKNIAEAAPDVELAAQLIKSLDPNHPVLSSWGEPNHPSIATTEEVVNDICPSVEVWSINAFRGRTFTNLFDQWKDIVTQKTIKPMFIAEFGCDAYDINKDKEDQTAQRNHEYYQWRHIAENLSAEDPDKVCGGGVVFEFNDEWWKTGGLYSHGTDGWSTSNCPDGHASEEWWGLVDIDRNIRESYTLMQEYFGGQIPEPPDEQPEDFNVVQFSTQPDVITTNLPDYPIMGAFKDATEVKINNQVITLDYYDGFVEYYALDHGNNNFTLNVTLGDGSQKEYQKTVIYDADYLTGNKKMLYVDDLVIDLDAGAVLGKLPSKVIALSNNGEYFLDGSGNEYSTADHLRTGRQLNMGSGSSHAPLFSNDDSVLYSQEVAVDYATGNLITDQVPVDVKRDYCKISSDDYIFYIDSSVIKKIDPVTFEVLEDMATGRSRVYLGGSGISKDGTLALATSYSYAYGALDIIEIATETRKTISGLSDYMGEVLPSADGQKIFVGGYGNSYYGKGGVYVIDKATQEKDSFYLQFGGRRLAVSSDGHVFVSSACKDHYGNGSLVQGSIYHRGIEELTLNDESILEYQKSYFLGLPHNYSMPIKIFHKNAD